MNTRHWLVVGSIVLLAVIAGAYVVIEYQRTQPPVAMGASSDHRPHSSMPVSTPSTQYVDVATRNVTSQVNSMSPRSSTTTVVDVDPKVPASITKETSIYDKDFTTYIRDKVRYVQAHSTPDEERAIMEKVYRGLPFVKEATLTQNPNVLHIVTFKGETDDIGLAQPRRLPSKVGDRG